MSAAPAPSLDKQQRPTRNSMGQNAVCWQMDVRAGFGRRRRTDIHYRRQGISAAWPARALNSAGNFIVAADEHDTPPSALEINLVAD